MRISQPIALFALVSVGVHAAALVLSPSHSLRALAPGQVATSLQVRLTTSNANQASVSQPAPKKASKQKRSPLNPRSAKPVGQPSYQKLIALATNQKARPVSTTSIQTPRTENATAHVRQVRATQPTTKAMRSAAVSAASLASRRNHVRARLQRELATFFRYPYMAQRRGWHGQVVLGVSIMPSGQISHVAVQHSSGHSVLDEAAVSAMHRVTKLDWAPALLQGDAVEIQLPVIYRLLGG